MHAVGMSCSGTFYIAEVTSRLVDKPAFIKLVSSFGFEMIEHVCPSSWFHIECLFLTQLPPISRSENTNNAFRSFRIPKNCDLATWNRQGARRLA